MILKFSTKEAYEIADEMQRIASEMSKGNWIPFAMVVLLISVIIFLLIHIYNNRLQHIDRRQKEQEKKHDKHDEYLTELRNTNVQLAQLIAVHESEIKHVKEKVK